jgi:hypothetical protein
MAKYNDVTAGQTEACINRMGGWNNFLRFIGGEGKIVFNSILTFITTVKISARPIFNATNAFEVLSESISVCGYRLLRISFIDDEFKGMTRFHVEESIEEVELIVSKLTESSSDDRILTELGDKAVTTISQLFALMRMQGNGEAGPLLVNGHSNIFYLIKKDGEMRVTHVHWAPRGWCVNVRFPSNSDEQLKDSQVVSRK